MNGEKTSATKPDIVHREGDADSDDLTNHEDELQRRVSRRPSAALNVIQNPLQVCVSIETMGGQHAGHGPMQGLARTVIPHRAVFGTMTEPREMSGLTK